MNGKIEIPRQSSIKSSIISDDSSFNSDSTTDRGIYSLQNQSDIDIQNHGSSIRNRRASLTDSRGSSFFLDSIGANSKRITRLMQGSNGVNSSITSFHTTSPTSRGNNKSSKLNPRNSVYRSNDNNTKDPKLLIRRAKYLLTTIDKANDEDKKKIIQEAKNIFKKLSKSNISEATYILGTWKELGLYGSSVSKTKAFGLYTTASKMGYPPAIDKVAFNFESKKEYTPAVAYYKKASALGDPAANYRLGIAFIFGELKLVSNSTTALFYLRRSATQADATFPQGAYIMALILLGIYEVDLGIRDTIEAQEHLHKAASLGYEPALFKLGFCYEFGEYGYTINSDLSIKNYTMAAQKGHADSQMSISGWYLTGAPGVLEHNDELAFKWCKRAAVQKFPKAQFAMGYYYEVGVSVPVNMSLAMEWYNLAAANGSKDAKKRLEKALPALPKSQIDRKKKSKEGCSIS